MNKFQEALNKIVQSVCPTHKNCQECNFEKACNSEAKEWVDTLQELIDKYELATKNWNEPMTKDEMAKGEPTICGLSLDEAIPVIEMYKQIKATTHQLKPIEDLMMGTKGQYYYDGKHSVEELSSKYNKMAFALNDLFHYIEFDNISSNQLKKAIKRMWSELNE